MNLRVPYKVEINWWCVDMGGATRLRLKKAPLMSTPGDGCLAGRYAKQLPAASIFGLCKQILPIYRTLRRQTCMLMSAFFARTIPPTTEASQQLLYTHGANEGHNVKLTTFIQYQGLSLRGETTVQRVLWRTAQSVQ